MNLERVGYGLDLYALQLTQFHSLEFELQAVPTDFHWTHATRHGHLPALGGSVYFIEGRSAVGSSALLGRMPMLFHR